MICIRKVEFEGTKPNGGREHYKRRCFLVRITIPLGLKKDVKNDER